MEYFLCKGDKTFLEKALKYFLTVWQSYSTQQALQNLNFYFNSIPRYRVTIYQKVQFIGKDNSAIYLYDVTLRTCVAHLVAVLWQLPFSFFWPIFLNFPFSWVSRCPKSAKNNPHGNCHRTAPRWATKFSRCHRKDKLKSYIFL